MVKTLKPHSFNLQKELDEVVTYYDKIVADLTMQQIMIRTQDGQRWLEENSERIIFWFECISSPSIYGSP